VTQGAEKPSAAPSFNSGVTAEVAGSSPVPPAIAAAVSLPPKDQHGT